MSTRRIHDEPAITTTGNQEERDAHVERIQDRHERLHRADATVGELAGLAKVRPDAQPFSDDESN